MLCVPTARLLVVKTAGVVPLIVPVPSVVPPSTKETVPVVVPAPGGVTDTVAVRVTVWPNAGLVGEAVRVVVVAAVARVDGGDAVRAHGQAGRRQHDGGRAVDRTGAVRGADVYEGHGAARGAGARSRDCNRRSQCHRMAHDRGGRGSAERRRRRRF